MIRWIVLGALVAAAGCTSVEPTTRDLDSIQSNYYRQQADADEQQHPQQDTCGLERFRHLIGTPADAIDQSTLPPHTRIIRPGMMITQDFSPQRLNLRIAPDGKVASIGCF
ncbi:MAG TPA: I78 family peptidase inhibitor [Caulobacterales bacterium]|nr:I78 family peptidase inhibitor [Caulobacterales bacterium]